MTRSHGGAEARILGLPTVDDRTLWEGLCEGRPRANAAFYDRFEGEVNRLVWRLLGADAEHDDLVQQIFCKLLESARSVRHPEALRGWVRSVTVNAVRSELRRRRVRRFWLGELPDADAYEGVQCDPETRQLITRAYAVLKSLPADDHVAFVLHYVDECSIAEVAELTACSTATVKRRLARGREKVAALLGNEPRSGRGGADE